MQEQINQSNKAFRSIIVHFRDRLREGDKIPTQEREFLKSYFNAMKLKVEFDIMDRCVENDYSLKLAEEKLSTIKADITRYIENIDKVINSTSSEQARLLFAKRKSLQKTLIEVDTLLKSVERRNFKAYSEVIANNIKTKEELLAACTLVLTTNVQNFNEYFQDRNLLSRDEKGNTVVDESLLARLLIDINNKNLLEQAEGLYDREEKVSEINSKINSNNTIVELLKKVQEHESDIRSYLTKQWCDQVPQEEIQRELASEKEQVSSLKIRLYTLNNQLNDLNNDMFTPNNVIESKLRIINLVKEELSKKEDRIKELVSKLDVKERLREIGLGFIIDHYRESEPNVSKEEADIIRILKNKLRKNTSLDVTQDITDFEQEKWTLLEKKPKLERALADYSQKIRPEELLYLENNREYLKKVTKIARGQTPSGYIPLNILYVLQSICIANNLTPEEIIKACRFDIETEKLRYSYQEKINEISCYLMDKIDSYDENLGIRKRA